MRDDQVIAAYTRNVGHEPRNLPDDHPDLWQWLYRGGKEERARAMQLLGLVDADEDTPVVIDGQESLL